MKPKISFSATLVTLISVIFSSCSEVDDLGLEIQSEQWELIYIREGGVSTIKENKEYFHNKAFVLVFDSDSTYILNSGVNHAGGRYMHSGMNEICIYSYHEYTEVGSTDKNERQLTNRLIQKFPTVNQYAINGTILSLFTDDGKIVFSVLEREEE